MPSYFFKQETLKEVQTSIEWQLSTYKSSLFSSSNFDSQGEACSEARKCKRMKVEKQSCSGNLRKEALLATIRTSSGGPSLKDIAGLEHVKSVLWKSVIFPLQCQSLLRGRKTWNHILLYGPPGTGKSKIATAVANDSQLSIFSISSADLLSQWVGESEKTIKDLFEIARSTEKTAIIFIDEIDGVCRKRSDSEGDYSRRVKNQMLIEMDNNLNSEKRCILLCATNCPWDLDVAFMRRFQCRVFLPLPDKSARLKILRDQCKDVDTNMSDGEWDMIASLSEGYSGADLTNLAMFAIQEPLDGFQYNQSEVASNQLSQESAATSIQVSPLGNVRRCTQ
ncbi:hypothetical protein GE061_002619 [Apolygus lucorum]|uniref:AAA+ ATPase domain-containing protein n=1 Tax=Apolygus lucorum TaxID=248454 RepID=A0A8S9X711_APOLU|nr:hypothetical protein GE061_002619 [Apolygus lucorum]